MSYIQVFNKKYFLMYLKGFYFNITDDSPITEFIFFVLYFSYVLQTFKQPSNAKFVTTIIKKLLNKFKCSSNKYQKDKLF